MLRPDEHEHRFNLVRSAQVGAIDELTYPLLPRLLIIEEYGDLRDPMLSSRRTADAESESGAE